MNLSDRIHDRTVRDTLQVLRYEAGLSKRVLAHLRGLERDLKAALADAGDIRTKKRLNALLKEAQEAIRDRYAGAQGVYDQEIPQFVSAQAESMRATLNGLVKVDIFRHSLTTEQIQAIASDTLITGAPSAEWWAAQSSDTLAKFTRIVRMGMLQGQTGDEMAREVRDMMGTSMRNAQSLVRTSVITTNNAAHMALYEANADVLKGVQWSSSLDMRTCQECGSLDAKTWEMGEKHPMPSLHFGCFVAGTKVKAPTVLRGYARPYAGNVVIVRTAGGDDVTCTPNHPILTDHGWVAAGHLKKGQKVAKAPRGDWAVGPAPDGVEVETSIEDVVASGLRSGGMRPVLVPLTPQDFHGDATSEDVAVVWTNGELFNDADTSGNKHFAEDILVDGPSSGTPGLSSESGEFLLPDGLGPSSSGSMGFLCESCSLVRASLTHTEEHRLTSVPGGNPVAGEDMADGLSGDVKKISEALNAFSAHVASNDLSVVDAARPCASYLDTSENKMAPESAVFDAQESAKGVDGFTGLIAFDDVIEIVEVLGFSGHVYNLETEGNWYVANGIITHNCRCAILPVTKSFEELTGIKGLDDIPESTRASMDGQVASSTTYLEWLGRQDAATKADILGPGRARLLESGKISLSDLVDQRGNELTLADLRKR